MIANTPGSQLPDHLRVVVTGIGLTSPNGNSYREFRENLLNGVSGVSPYNIRYVGDTLAGICDYDEQRYQSRKAVRRGTRAGSIGIYCAKKPSRTLALIGKTLTKIALGFMLA